MELTKVLVKRNGCDYVDLFLSWEYEGKTFRVRVRPVFSNDYRMVVAAAKSETLQDAAQSQD